MTVSLTSSEILCTLDPVCQNWTLRKNGGASSGPLSLEEIYCTLSRNAQVFDS